VEIVDFAAGPQITVKHYRKTFAGRTLIIDRQVVQEQMATAAAGIGEIIR
jgi:hypothetical protein